jgi:hypothetical protein
VIFDFGKHRIPNFCIAKISTINATRAHPADAEGKVDFVDCGLGEQRSAPQQFVIGTMGTCTGYTHPRFRSNLPESEHDRVML